MTKSARDKTGLAILIIEDDPTLGPALLQRLRLEGHEPCLVITGADALAFAARQRFDVILSDIRLPDMSGEKIWRHIVERRGLLPTWFMTAFGEIDQAVRLVKGGARDYLTKPIDIDTLVDALKGLHTDRTANPATRSSSLGRSPVMTALAIDLAKAARSDLPVLLHGETGSGKEVAARFLHDASPRAGSPFVALNCAAIPRDLAESFLFGHEKGAFTGAIARHVGAAEEAAAGTLFLDEIAELPLELQPKLLRLIEAKTFRPVGAGKDIPFRARIVSASHADLGRRVEEHAFREDLFFRLHVVALAVPPLRARPEDVPDLAQMFLEQIARSGIASAHVLGDDARSALVTYHWPGNVRELRNRIERAAVMCEGTRLSVHDLFPETALEEQLPIKENQALDETAREAIRQRVRQALDDAGGNQSEAARRLGVSRTTIWKYRR